MLPRCEAHEPPNGTEYTYVAGIEPVGYPETAIRCGRKQCTKPALAFLTRDEYPDYLGGEQIFSLPNRTTMRVKVKPESTKWVNQREPDQPGDAMDW